MDLSYITKNEFNNACPLTIQCQMWADCVIDEINYGESVWFSDHTGKPSIGSASALYCNLKNHAVVHVNGKFYDALNPCGVEKLEDLNYYKIMG